LIKPKTKNKKPQPGRLRSQQKVFTQVDVFIIFIDYLQG